MYITEFRHDLPTETLRIVAIDGEHTSGITLLKGVEIDITCAEPATNNSSNSLCRNSDDVYITGSDGTVHLDVPPDRYIIVTARKPGYLPDSVLIAARTDQGTCGCIGEIAKCVR